MKILKLSVKCMKNIYVPTWISVTLSAFDLQPHIYLTRNTPRISQFWISSLENSFVNAGASLLLRHMMLPTLLHSNYR